MNKNIVITGGTGFVGSNLAEYLLKKGFKIFLITRANSNLSNLENIIDDVEVFSYDSSLNKLISFFEKVNPNCVFHLASNFIAEHNTSQIDSLIESNITFGLHVLQAMKEAGVNKIINTGTSWQHYKNEQYNPVCLYAATKQAFETLLEYYIKAEGFTGITLKLFDTYGETDTRPKLINFLNKFADEQTELNMSPGEQMLNLVHIDDVCSAFETAYNLLLVNEANIHLTYAIANKKNYKLKDLIKVFEKATNKKVNVLWGGKPYRKREVMKLWNKGEELPNWKPKISLEQGLKRYNNI
jgi:nucleoside-diphosphate-sugar epimerase